MQSKTARDRQIYDAFAAGQSLELISETYALTMERVGKIIVSERHKREVSSEAYYRNLRLREAGTPDKLRQK